MLRLHGGRPSMAGLLVLAGGGLAREVIAQERELGRFDEILVLDDDPRLLGTLVGGARVAGGIDAVADHPQHQVLVCCGRPQARSVVVDRVCARGVQQDRFATSIAPTASIGRGSVVGAGSVLLAGTVLTADVVLGSHVVCMPQVVLTHDDVVGDHATLCAGVTLGGSVVVGRSAYLGMRASVREGVRVGAGSVLGMGSVLLDDLPDGATWAGVPARPLAATSGASASPPATRPRSPLGLAAPAEQRRA